MNLSPAADVPAPRTAGDPIAMRAAYTSGMVFNGQIPLPTIDHRQYLERELDMHNVHQSFAVRKRVIQKMGNSDHLVIWFTDTMPGVTKASQSFEAIAVMDEWMANIQANPTKSVAENRPAKAVDSCFDVNGKLMYSGPNVWDGIINDKPKGACTWAFPMFGTSRTVAGAPIEGGIYKCALKPVDTAVADGTYAPWMPDAAAVTKLKQIFPDGVCDYSKPDQARPRPENRSVNEKGPRKRALCLGPCRFKRDAPRRNRSPDRRPQARSEGRSRIDRSRARSLAAASCERA